MTFTLLEARLGGAASADSARWATEPHLPTPADRSGGRPAPQTALMGPTETVAMGASGRTCSPPPGIGDVLGGRGLPLCVHRILLDREMGAVGADVEDDVLRTSDRRSGSRRWRRPHPRRACGGRRGRAGPLRASSLATSGERTPETTGAKAELSVENSIHWPVASAAWDALEARQALEAGDVALDVGDAADDEDGDRSLTHGDGLAPRGRPGVAALDEGLLGLGRVGGVVHRPGMGGGERVLVEGGGARVGARRRGSDGRRPGRHAGGPRSRQQHACHQPSR